MPDYTFGFVPGSRSYNMISGFVQDEIEIVDDKFYVTLGSKFEGNSFTGFEYQPSARGLWVLDKRHVLWGAVSRAVRTPNRYDEDVRIRRFIPPFIYVDINGNPNINSEEVIAYELGYRAQTTKRFAWDVSLFYNKYRNLTGIIEQSITPMPPIIFINSLENCGHGETYGFEWTASWEATSTWKLGGSYSFLVTQSEYYDPNGNVIRLPIGNNFNDPRNQVRLQSYWSFAPNWEFDVFLRYVDQFSTEIATTPSYLTMDVRLGWRPRKNLEFSIVGQNLFSPSHAEMNYDTYYGEPNYQTNRAVFAKMTWTR
jgi:iron complex outermembrane receptor protein